ncbi:hypothetical protein [Novosphingobium mangrovi (ex Huang et al. 2023)]|uniref:Lysozyme inhibitor LprI N-terminal domain-containing protein n=1 Tax=Novosphingobium mangrovi (ex Huang et al. 2023) TaxID=2976432 RepID=A0ABT2I934_9SPHN|nr:hypothetical protein [Novosphingobium mangrovi (ex Huang et al. 2023)]MCT2401334.1 hypothetical protein [Novosphingobium mangrovi (ex Huang et al. 2023)]
MHKHANAILKIALALAALVAGGGVGFYYGIFLPAQDMRRQRMELLDRKAAAEAQNQAMAEQARRVQEQAKRIEAAQAAYDECVNFAEVSYKQRWSQSCQSLHDADQAAFEDCADDLFSTESGCRAKHPIRPASDCALPARMARELSGTRDQRKAECMAKLQVVQAGP